jgi:hypothetical protein
MFKRFFRRRESDIQKDQAAATFVPKMPQVEELPNSEEIFEKARKAARSEESPPSGGSGRHVILVTPSRLLMFVACPAAGSMPRSQVASIEEMISSKVKRNIAVIAYTQLEALMADKSKVIPFLGLLMGFAYIGHSVWVFEGHASALAAGCRGADVLIVDGGMIPHLAEDWAATASGVMRNKGIYVHDRSTYSLRKLT